MYNDIKKYLNQNYHNIYKLDQVFINDLFIELKTNLKIIGIPNFKLKKSLILKDVYKYFIEILHIDPIIINISKRKQPEQRTPEWYDMRYNMVTASDAATVITKLENISESEMKHITPHKAFKSKKDLIRTKILRDDIFKGNKYTQHGQIFEEVASLIYQKRQNTYIIEFGLIKHPTINIIGASPDGITKDKIMIEIKAPYSRVINGLIPSNYWIQMQLQLEVCDLEMCHFIEIKSSMYQSESDYYNDINPNNKLLTEEGLEKGVIIRCYNKALGKNLYMYPHIDIYKDFDLLEDWKEKTYNYNKTVYDDVEICYWKITKYLCSDVKRDKNWFDSNLNKFYDFWKEVDYYKNNKLEFDKLILKKSKTQSKNKVLMISDSDSDTETSKKNKVLMISDSDSDTETPQKNNQNTKTPQKNNQNTDLNSDSIKNNQNTDLNIDLIVNDL